jgi:hypothetical protein
LNLNSKRDFLYLVLGGLFVTNAILGEVIGSKLIQVGPYIATIGVLPWPFVFLTTDLINEYFGKPGVRRLTLLTVALILYAFAVLFVSMQIPAAAVSPVSDTAFNAVFGQSLWIIAGSVTAFLISQLADVFLFWMFRDRTGGRHLWLRATGSTAISQLIDTFVVQGIAFWLPGKLTTEAYVEVALTSYTYKFAIAVGLTPLIYAAHGAIDRYLGKEQSREAIQEAASTSLR